MCQTPEQEALATALEIETQRLGTPESYFYQMVEDLKEKRKKLVKSLKEAGCVPVVPEGGYFVMTNWRALGK
jgi:kynurenine--oxoglutarate transaminase/cysteine-S-conjugate beta-lyase/glutamine--phenylpyruvate transaminase